MLILPDKTTMADVTNQVSLLELAKNRFANIEPARENLFERFFRDAADGVKTDCTRGSDTEDDPANAKAWTEDRIIPAEWLSWLCTDPRAAAKITSRGIEIDGVKIDGRLDLAWAKIQFPIRTFKCAFTGKIILDRSILLSLDLQGTHITALDGDSLTVDRDIVFWDGFLARGRVWLRNATIGRNLECDGGQFLSPGAIALNLEEAKVNSVRLGKGFKAEGEVRLHGATIAANLECDGGQFIN